MTADHWWLGCLTIGPVLVMANYPGPAVHRFVAAVLLAVLQTVVVLVAMVLAAEVLPVVVALLLVAVLQTVAALLVAAVLVAVVFVAVLLAVALLAVALLVVIAVDVARIAEVVQTDQVFSTSLSCLCYDPVWIAIEVWRSSSDCSEALRSDPAVLRCLAARCFAGSGRLAVRSVCIASDYAVSVR